MRQPAASLGSLGLRHTENEEIFVKARAAQVISLTKDQDFAHSVTHLGPPPQVIWLRCGDTSEEQLKELLTRHWDRALEFISKAESLVKIR